MADHWTFPTAFRSWGREEQAAINRVMKSERFTMAGEVEAFEGEFAAYHSRKHGIMVNSGSSANLIAVGAHQAKCPPDLRGGMAQVPAIAWATTYAPLVQANFDFRVDDVDDTWNASPVNRRWIADGIAYGPRVLVACSILGNPGYLSDKTPCTFIEDNCESLGARTADGRLCGTFGDLSTFSFFWSHQLSAIEGGMVLTDDDELARLCRLLRNHGNDGWGSDDFERQYNFTLFGYNVRPLELHAAIAREQLKKLDGLIEARRENLAHFTELAIALRLPIVLQRIQGRPSPFGLAFRVETSERRRALAAALRAAGIDCRLPTGGSFTKHPYGAPWRDQLTPNADLIHDTGLFCGNAPWPIPDLIERAIRVMRDTL